MDPKLVLIALALTGLVAAYQINKPASLGILMITVPIFWFVALVFLKP